MKVLEDLVPVGPRNQGKRSEYTIHMNVAKYLDTSTQAVGKSGSHVKVLEGLALSTLLHTLKPLQRSPT